MKTKIIDGIFHFKEKEFIFIDGDIKPIKQIGVELRIVENEGITYVVSPIDIRRSYEGYMIPIVENYDSLK